MLSWTYLLNVRVTSCKYHPLLVSFSGCLSGSVGAYARPTVPCGTSKLNSHKCYIYTIKFNTLNSSSKCSCDLLSLNCFIPRVRKAHAWRALHDLKNIWHSAMPDDLKRAIFMASVESILLYGSEAWTPVQEARLDVCYTSMPRMVFNVTWRDRVRIHPIKCRHLADRSCTSGAIRRIDHTLVATPGGQVTN